jgi:predicted enzyme related to lactoylglutathione lyase
MSFTAKWRIAFIYVVLSSIAACASVNINLPSVTDSPTGERLPGKIIWRDLLTNDPAASQKFYGELFGWEFESVGTASNLESDSSYTLIRHNGQLIGGMIDTLALNGRRDISQWVVLMSVEDVDASTEAVTANGGTIITPPTDLQSRGRLAVIRDAEGALLGLLETRDGDPRDSDPDVDGFLWDELWTSDVGSADAFYTKVAGLTKGTVDVDGMQDTAPTYSLLKAGDTPRAGIMPNPLEGLDPVWVSYIRVEDPAAITSRVAELGGRVIVEAGPRPVGGEVAFVAGPSGAGIALQTWPLEQNNQDLNP